MSTRKLLTIIIILQTSLPGFSQTRTVEGNVTAFYKYPLKNIEVIAKKSNAKTTTDASGHFSIEIKDKDVIKIKNSLFHGYEEKISNDMDSLTVNLIFEEPDRNIGKAVDEGYFTKEDLDYALENLFKENNIYSLYANVDEAIKYAVAEALMVESSSGRRAFILRGTNSLTGNNNALYLVHKNVTGDISYTTPSEIRKIYKLSNSQAAVYARVLGME
jgi:hypothetical protein